MIGTILVGVCSAAVGAAAGALGAYFVGGKGGSADNSISNKISELDATLSSVEKKAAAIKQTVVDCPRNQNNTSGISKYENDFNEAISKFGHILENLDSQLSRRSTSYNSGISYANTAPRQNYTASSGTSAPQQTVQPFVTQNAQTASNTGFINQQQAYRQNAEQTVVTENNPAQSNVNLGKTPETPQSNAVNTVQQFATQTASQPVIQTIPQTSTQPVTQAIPQTAAQPKSQIPPEFAAMYNAMEEDYAKFQQPTQPEENTEIAVEPEVRHLPELIIPVTELFERVKQLQNGNHQYRVYNVGTKLLEYSSDASAKYICEKSDQGFSEVYILPNQTDFFKTLSLSPDVYKFSCNSVNDQYKIRLCIADASGNIYEKGEIMKL